MMEKLKQADANILDSQLQSLLFLWKEDDPWEVKHYVDLILQKVNKAYAYDQEERDKYGESNIAERPGPDWIKAEEDYVYSMVKMITETNDKAGEERDRTLARLIVRDIIDKIWN